MVSENTISKRGSRFQAEKTLIIVVYSFIVIATLWWVLSAGNLSNDLGVSATFEKVGALESPTFFIKNESGSDWSNVRVAVDKQYLYKTELVKEDDTLILRPEDFDYYYYIPRLWGRESWESVAEEPKPSRKADDKLSPQLIEIRADQGLFSVTF